MDVVPDAVRRGSRESMLYRVCRVPESSPNWTCYEIQPNTPDARDHRARRPRTVSVSIRFLFLTCMLSIGVAPCAPVIAQTDSHPAERLAVGSVAEFDQALAGNGEAKTIALKPGVYEELAIRNVAAGTALTVVAAEPANRPVIHKLSISGSRNVMLEGLRFVGTGQESSEAFLAEIRQSQNIRIRKSEFSSPQGQAASSAGALLAVEVTTLHIADTIIENLRRGLMVERSAGIVIEHNRFRRLEVEGVGVTQSDGVTFDSNWLDEFRPDSFRARFFAMSTRQTSAASRNIQISRNVMIQVGGESISGIVLNNEEKKLYENVNIEKNIIITSSPYAILVDNANNSFIKDNITVDSLISTYNISIRLQNSKNSESSRNVSVAFNYNGSQNILTVKNITVPRHGGLTNRRILERALAGLNSHVKGSYPVHAGHAILPEHRAAGPRL